jgi:ADP-ribose pyrophosphatase
MAIPQHAKKVFEGVIFDVYQWEQELFDGTFKTFEAIKPLNNVIVIPLFKDKIYVHKEEQPNGPPFIGLPAGRFEKGETDPILVAQRELLEETGCTAESFELLRSRSITGTMEKTTYVVIARECTKITEPKLDAGERLHATMFLSFDEFIEASQGPEFSGGELAMDCMKATMDYEFRESFRKSIFGV